MTDSATDIAVTVKQIAAKLNILRNFLIVANEGQRQQQSAANDECISVLKDISDQLTKLLRGVEK